MGRAIYSAILVSFMASALQAETVTRFLVVTPQTDLEGATEFRDTLAATGILRGEIDLLDVRSSTPTISQLRDYASILIYSNFEFHDPVRMGNVLADYVDEGGGVIVSPFAVSNTFSSLQGRFSDQGYAPLENGDLRFLFAPMTITNTGNEEHPIFSGFTGLALEEPTLTLDNVTVSSATVLARWSNDVAFVAESTMHPGKVVSINMYPEHASDPGPSARGAEVLYANAFNFVGGAAPIPEPSILVTLIPMAMLAYLRRTRRNNDSP